MAESKFIAADLHIHTPASKCYQGNKDDDEYIAILKNYHDKNIKIIAITDHNTLKGYKEIQRIKNETKQKIEILEGYKAKIPELDSELEILKSNSELFKKLTILPGVEFEANPGIHLLFIFDPAQDLNEIDNLLENNGYPASLQGLETPDNEIIVPR